MSGELITEILRSLDACVEKLLNEFKTHDPSPQEVIAIQVLCEHLATLPGVLPPEA